jgi:hypothetical protein
VLGAGVEYAELHLQAGADADLEIFTAEERSELLASSLDRTIHFRPAQPPR